jgi:hypothetical protein
MPATIAELLKVTLFESFDRFVGVIVPGVELCMYAMPIAPPPAGIVTVVLSVETFEAVEVELPELTDEPVPITL